MISNTINVVVFDLSDQKHIKVVNAWSFFGIPVYRTEQYCGQLPYQFPPPVIGSIPGVQMTTANQVQ